MVAIYNVICIKWVGLPLYHDNTDGAIIEEEHWQSCGSNWWENNIRKELWSPKVWFLDYYL